MLALENQFIPGLAVKAKEFRGKLADRKKTGATAKTSPKGQLRKRATAPRKGVEALVAEPVNANEANVRLVAIWMQSKADAAMAQTDLKNCKERLGEVKLVSKLASSNLEGA